MMDTAQRWLTSSPLTEVEMWRDWEHKVRVALPFFAQSPVYVRQDDTQEEHDRVARIIRQTDVVDIDGRVRDAEFGGRVVITEALGPLTRMWLDANVEIDFLRRHLPEGLSQAQVLDIGAGYGRLAASLQPLVKHYTCVDAVPISTFVCEYYTQRFVPDTKVLTIREFIERPTPATVAINVHSWNECSNAQIERWLCEIHYQRIPYLMTVQHDHSYYSWSGGQYRTNLEHHCTLLAEEHIGLNNCPHAIWKLR